jgi:uncharacterized membrane protein YccC
MTGPGHNNPPVDPFDAFSAHIGDLFEEAKNFLDGAGVESQGQADAVATLMDQLRKAAKDADKARTEEKKPHDDAAKAVQSKWKPLLDKADLATRTAKDALAPWLQKLEDEKRAIADAARREADAKAAAAAEAIRQAQSLDLAAQEQAEALLKAAKQSEAAANRAENDKAHAHGGSRAAHLRSYWTPALTDPSAALRHYVTTNPEAVKAFLLDLAVKDVASGKRQVPGFEITEERKVA